MRSRKYGLYHWALGLILAPALVAAPPARAQAAGVATLALAPASNVPHGAEQVSGAGFDPLATVTLSISSSTGASPIGSLQADATGTIAGTVILPLALDAGVPNTISAREVGSATMATTTLIGVAVTPLLGNGQQVTGRVGDPISLRAVGFAPLDPVTISIGNAPATLPYSSTSSLVSGADGTLVATVTVPAAAQTGPGQIVATGGATGIGQTDRATLPINVVGTQGLVVTPEPAPVGSTVEVAGSGFAAGEPIAVTLAYTDTVPDAAAVISQAAQADVSGNLDLRLNVPATARPNSDAIIAAHGERSGLSLSLLLPLVGQPTLTFSPPASSPGGTLLLSGTGFRSGERLAISTTLFTLPAAGLAADGTGSFSATTTLHAGLAPGIYTLAAVGSTGDQASARLTISAAAVPTLILGPSTVAPGGLLQVSGARFLPEEPVQLSLGSQLITPTEGPVVATAVGDFTATVTVPSVAASGLYPLTARGLLTGAQGSQPLNVRLPVVGHSYFAEGYTGQGAGVRFSESLALLNTTSMTATGQIEYFLSNGITSTVPITLPAQTHITEDVGRDVGANQMVSAMVEADQPIAATRIISRTTEQGTELGASVSSGVSSLSQTWYYAEGYTGASFQEYLALFNPGATPAAAVIQPAVAAGAAPAPINSTIPPRGRVTLNIRALLPNRTLGLLVQADQPIAAERILYWGAGAGSGKYGTTVGSGVTGPAALWLLPYASTSNGDQVFVAITDPTSVAAHVQVSGYGDGGPATLSLSATVEPGSRVTLPLPILAGGHGGPIGLVVSSDVPVVSEEAQYFGGSPNSGAHDGSVLAGSPQPAGHWAFPGVDTAGYTSVQWYVLNTGSQAATLTATLFSMQAQPVQVQFHAAAGRLTNLTLGSTGEVPSGVSSAWSSNVPVEIVQVLRSADGSRGLLVAGIPQEGS